MTDVTQEDRDAAAALVEWHNKAASEWHLEGGADLRFFATDMPEGIRRGIWDDHPVVQAFAVHRIAAESKGMMEAAGIADALAEKKLAQAAKRRTKGSTNAGNILQQGRGAKSATQAIRQRATAIETAAGADHDR